jgi:nitric oxide reductase NorE protein
VLLRTGASSWPQAGTLLDIRQALINTGLLALATLATVWLSKRGLGGRAALVTGAALAIAFVILKLMEYQSKLAAGLRPSNDLLLACWFTLTGVHALHVAAGAAANLWVAAGGVAASPQTSERLRALGLYWALVDLVWLAILISFYAY